MIVLKEGFGIGEVGFERNIRGCMVEGWVERDLVERRERERGEVEGLVVIVFFLEDVGKDIGEW